MRLVYDIYGLPFLITDESPHAASPLFYRAAAGGQWKFHSWRLTYHGQHYYVTQEQADIVLYGEWDLQRIVDEALEKFNEGAVPSDAPPSPAIGFN